MNKSDKVEHWMQCRPSRSPAGKDWWEWLFTVLADIPLFSNNSWNKIKPAICQWKSSIIYHNLFFLLVFYFLCSLFFSLSMHILWSTFGYSPQTNRHFILQMWVLQNHSNKTNIYFVTIMQVFHIELYVFEVLLMQ